MLICGPGYQSSNPTWDEQIFMNVSHIVAYVTHCLTERYQEDNFKSVPIYKDLFAALNLILLLCVKLDGGGIQFGR